MHWSVTWQARTKKKRQAALKQAVADFKEQVNALDNKNTLSSSLQSNSGHIPKACTPTDSTQTLAQSSEVPIGDAHATETTPSNAQAGPKSAEDRWATLRKMLPAGIEERLKALSKGSADHPDKLVVFRPPPHAADRDQRRQLHILIKDLFPKLHTDTHVERPSQHNSAPANSGTQPTAEVCHFIRVWHGDILGDSTATATATNAAVQASLGTAAAARGEAGAQNAKLTRRQRRGWRGDAVLPLPAGNSLLCGTDQGRPRWFQDVVGRLALETFCLFVREAIVFRACCICWRCVEGRRMELFFEAIEAGQHSRVYHLVQAGVNLDQQNEYASPMVLSPRLAPILIFCC